RLKQEHDSGRPRRRLSRREGRTTRVGKTSDEEKGPAHTRPGAEAMDDDALEVTQLRGGAPGPRASQAAGNSIATGTTGTTGTTGVAVGARRATERAGSWQARRGQRHRLALTLLSAGLVALTLLALLALTQPDPWAAVGAYLHLPTATPTQAIAPGGGII